MIIPTPKQRRSIRLAGVDYQQMGQYFITLCVEQRLPLFGLYHHQGVRLNPAGHMLDEQWRTLLGRFSGISLDAYVVMPDHFHAIVSIDSHEPSPPPKLGTLVCMFKYRTHYAYLDGVRKYSWPIYGKRLWQRNYFEHIIRNEQDYHDCQAYILHNPYEGWRKHHDR